MPDSIIPDISALALPELIALMNATVERIKEMRETGIRSLRDTIADQAELYGVTIAD